VFEVLFTYFLTVFTLILQHEKTSMLGFTQRV